MSKNTVIGTIAVVAIAAGFLYYFTSMQTPAPVAQVVPPQATSQTHTVSQENNTSAAKPSASPAQTTKGNDVDTIAADFNTSAQSEATQANSENGTEGASQLNSSVDNQSVYGE